MTTINSGYDDAELGAAMKTHSILSNQRQLVELLQTEPIIDYLLQNGALHEKDVEVIEGESSPAKVNLALLRCLETNGSHAQNLLVNALRQTGQLHLASLLDKGIRIKTFTGSGYLSKKRHRGQLSLYIEIKALKFDQSSVLGLIHPAPTSPAATVTTREWVSVDDICRKISTLSESHTKLTSSHVHIVETEEAEPKPRSCLCACFASIFSSSKKKHKSRKAALYLDGGPGGDNNRNSSLKNSNQGGNRGTSPGRYISSHMTSSSTPSLWQPSLYNSQQELSHLAKLSQNASERASIENLRNLVELFTRKGEDVNSVLHDTTSQCRDNLIKYFEQKRGVLVLDTEAPSGGEQENNTGAFVVNLICTKTLQIQDLWRDLQSGQVTKDVEERVVNEEMLSRTGLLGIKFKAYVTQDDLDNVEQELN